MTGSPKDSGILKGSSLCSQHIALGLEEHVIDIPLAPLNQAEGKGFRWDKDIYLGLSCWTESQWIEVFLSKMREQILTFPDFFPMTSHHFLVW